MDTGRTSTIACEGLLRGNSCSPEETTLQRHGLMHRLSQVASGCAVSIWQTQMQSTLHCSAAVSRCTECPCECVWPPGIRSPSMHCACMLQSRKAFTHPAVPVPIDCAGNV